MSPFAPHDRWGLFRVVVVGLNSLTCSEVCLEGLQSMPELNGKNGPFAEPFLWVWACVVSVLPEAFPRVAAAFEEQDFALLKRVCLVVQIDVFPTDNNPMASPASFPVVGCWRTSTCRFSLTCPQSLQT